MNEDEAFEAVRAVLRGDRRFEIDAGSAKLLKFLLALGEPDALITAREFKAFFGAAKRASSYFRALAPPILSVLMERAGLERIDCPVVAELPAGDIEAPGQRPWRYEPRRVWIVPAETEVKLAFRSGQVRDRPLVRTIEADFEVALPDWGPQPPVLRDFAAPLMCPNCGCSSTRYRDLRDALVCLACARSFQHR